MPNIYLKVIFEKTDILKTLAFEVQKVLLQVNFCGAPNPPDIIKF